MADSTSSRPELLFRLFGGLRVWRGDVELELSPPKQRAMLGLLGRVTRAV